MRMIESFPHGDTMRDVLVAGGHAAILFQISRPEVTQAIWHRPLPGNLAEPAPSAELARLAAQHFDLALRVATQDVMDIVGAALPVPGPLHFLADMITLAGLFVALAGAQRVCLRLASRAEPNWAGVGKGLRLFTHYLGPAGGILPPGSVMVLKPGAPEPAWHAACGLPLSLFSSVT